MRSAPHRASRPRRCRARARCGAASRPLAQGRTRRRLAAHCADPRDRALVEAICFAVLRQPARYDAALKAWMPQPLRQARRRTARAAVRRLRPARSAGTARACRGGGDGGSGARARPRAPGRTGQCAAAPRAARRAARRRSRMRTGRHGCASALQRDWPRGPRAILAASAQAPPLWLRVNRRAACRATPIGSDCSDAGIEAQIDAGVARGACAWTRAVAVDRSCPASPRRGVGAGRVARNASPMRLAPAPGARVLDACAAPGGKAAHLLERDPSLRLIALDVDAARLDRVRGTFARLRRRRQRTLARRPMPPRSRAGGTARRSTRCCSTRRVRRPASCAASPTCCCTGANPTSRRCWRTQARLLDALWTTLAPGGVLLYATCSILKDENEAQVDAFLARTPDARRRAARRPLRPRPAARAASACPARWQDGFFYARLRKQ